MIQLTYFTTFRVIFNAINKFYGHMPQKERGNYLCYITKDGWFDAKQGIESLKKVDIVLIPKRSNEHLDIITSSSKYRQFMSSHQYIGSFGFLFTMNPDWSVVDFSRWNIRRLRISSECFKITLNRRKKICKGSKRIPECLYRNTSTVCVCEKVYEISQQIKENIRKN
jgi:hypothetical protein